MKAQDFAHPALIRSIARRTAIDHDSGCWNWTGGSFKRGGYACITCRPAGVIMARGNRVSWQVFRGEISKDQHVLHTCDNRLCINPDHLFLGDQALNMADKVLKGRQDRGESHGMAKLTEDQAVMIISDQRFMRQIASDYGVSMVTISDIKRGRSWGHLDRSSLFLRKRGYHKST